MKKITQKNFVITGFAVLVILLSIRVYQNYIFAPNLNDNNKTSLIKTYNNMFDGFSVKYPDGFTIDDTYAYQGIGPDKIIGGVKFTIPTSITVDTNLSNDSYISIESINGIPRTQSCVANLFLGQDVAAQEVVDEGVAYSVGSSTGAGAGNRYEETVYALSKNHTDSTGSCFAVRYFIHYGVIENYPVGAVKEFNKQKLLSEFDAIRRTLIVTQ